MKISLRWVASVTAALVVLLPLTVPAEAHSDLVDSTPTSGDRLTTAPTQVELVFGEPVQQAGGSIVVKASDGGRVDAPGTFSTDQNVATVQLTDVDTAGRYSVAYRVVSADGHVVTGTFTYQLAGPASETAPASETGPATDDPAVAATPLAGTTTDGGAGQESAGVVWVLGLGAIGLVLVAAIVAVALRGRRDKG